MKFIELFCGCGGLSLGMIEAGHEVIAAYDNDPDAVETYNRNLPPHAALADVRSLRGEDLPECEGIIGGPPCQPFSKTNLVSGGLDDSRNLIPDFIRITLERKPRFMLFENVPGLLEYKG